MTKVSANTNSARRCATAVETIKIPSPRPVGRKSTERTFQLGEREVENQGAGSSPLRRLQRLRGVDIQKRAMALDRDFRHRLAVPDDQMAGAANPLQRHPFL